LNQFETISVNPKEIQYIGIPDDEYIETEILPEWEEKISIPAGLWNQKCRTL
jgi:hypothetical protein